MDGREFLEGFEMDFPFASFGGPLGHLLFGTCRVLLRAGSILGYLRHVMIAFEAESVSPDLTPILDNLI